MPARYAELRCRSCFSFLEGASHPEELVGRAAELGLSALALADVNGLYGIVRAHAAAKECGLPLVVGAEVTVGELGPGRPGRVILLAIDRDGYGNLCRIVTSAHGGLPTADGTGPLRREPGGIAVPLRDVGARARGLFALYAGTDGEAAERLHDAFGRRFALAVARHRIAGEEVRFAAAQAIGRRLRVPVAVTNDVHTHVRQRQVLQDVLTCVRLGKTVERAGRRLFPNAERTLKGAEEMARLWSDFPEGLEAAVEIADACRFRMDELRGEHPLPPVALEREAALGEAAVALSSPGQGARGEGIAVVSNLRLRTSSANPNPAANHVPEHPPHPHVSEHPPHPDRRRALRALSLAFGERAAGFAEIEVGGSAPDTPAARGERGTGSSSSGSSISGSSTTGFSATEAAATTGSAITGMALLRELVREGAHWRYRGAPPDDVARQLAKELDLVESLGYASYFLTVWDVVRFARSRGILCQGRGSAANSAICFVLGITSIDPVRMGLLFERFISAERGEPPDIDVDFEHERREEVLQYVYERYGRDHAGMVCEVITYRAKSAIRDAGKALGLSLSQVDRLAKLVGSDNPLILSLSKDAVGPEIVAQAGLDVAESQRVRQTLAIARELQGFPRHLSIHVGGFVVTRRPLVETVPVEPAAMPGRTVVQWDKDDLAELGLLKVDLLALGMLTALSRALASLAAERPAPALPTSVPHPDSLATIPAEDPVVYDMLCEADAIGVFQIESRAQMSLAPRLKPRCFYDLVISVAIIRPGPIQGGMVHPYLRRRDGLEKVRYPYAPLEPVLAKTLGVPLFQEQAMRLAVIAAGFTPGEADELRRVMTHRRSHEKLAAMKARLIAGMAERKIPREDAEAIFQQLLGFAGYGFPESHSASFALLVYASAWIKRYHPAVFACALLNSQPMGFYAPHTLVEDAKRHGVPVRGVDVSCSGWESALEGATPSAPLTPGEAPALRVGLHAIRGLPRAVGDAIVAARRARPFESLGDLARRAGLSRAWLTRLAEAGALGSIAPARREAVWQSLALAAPGAAAEADLFAGQAPEEPPAPIPEPSATEEVSADFRTTGLSVRAHPMALIRPTLPGGGVRSARELLRMADGDPVEVAGLVIVRQRPETAAGIVFVSLEDETGIANLVVMPDVYERVRPVVRGAPFLVARGRVERTGAVVNVRVRSIAPLALAPSVGDRARDFR